MSGDSLGTSDATQSSPLEAERPPLSKDVFVSYASQDAAVANAVVEALERQGIRCWIAPRDVTPGEFYADAIVHAIDATQALILVLSQHAAVSHHILREVERASSKRHPVISLRIDRAALPAGLEYFLNTSQWLDASEGKPSRAFPKLVEAVCRVLTGSCSGNGGAPLPPLESMRGRKRRSSGSIAVVLGFIVVAILGFAIDKFWLSKHVTVEEHEVVTSPVNTPAVAVVAEKSIAVLPFLDLSEKHDQEYFADGMAEEILNLLAKIPELRVIGRTSSFQFKGHPSDLMSIGTALGAVYIVEGSVRRSGDHVRVTAQLIDARDGTHRWAETYDRDAGDVLMMQAEIAASLVRASQLEVAPPVYREPRLSQQNAEAYDVYLRGLHAKDRFDQRGFEEAVADQRHALELEPGFVPAAEQLALNQLNLVVWGFVPWQIGVEQARGAAETALHLDAKSALSHAILGLIYSAFDLDRSAAEREMKVAVALAPRNPKVLQFAGIERLSVGQLTSAVRLLDAARTLDPLDPALNFYCGEAYVRLDRLTEAESAVRRVLEVSPTYAGARVALAIVLLIERNAESALTELKKEAPVSLLGLSLVYQALHRYKEADAVLAHLEEVHAQDAPVSIAKVYAFRRQNDKAFEWLERARADKDVGLWLIKGDPLLKNLDGEPRYKDFLRKMNLPE